MKWEILTKIQNSKKQKLKAIKKTLIKNRKIIEINEFFNPKDPQEIRIQESGISDKSVKKVIDRIKIAKEKKEKVIIYGDYDADGICATAILWEALHEYGLDVFPYIPDRFSEGYGIKTTQISNLKSQNDNLKLVICVDNGIVAYDAIKKAKELGVDVIVIDHHSKGVKKLAISYVLHSTGLCGSGLAYFFAKELFHKVQPSSRLNLNTWLELACIGTIADQMPLIRVNRSIVKYGIEALNKTKRPGLLALYQGSTLTKVDPYSINYIIAPRINAMGRLAHGLDSLRLLCTKKFDKAEELSRLLTKTNSERQKIVDDVVASALKKVKKEKIIVMENKNYHEGVIGLIAGKLTEEFYRPAIVMSVNGDTAKASARSISGFNIIENIKKLEHLIIEGGGHPMAAGFSIKTKNIDKFAKEINKIADKILTDEILEKKMKIDCEIEFTDITTSLYKVIQDFEPFGNSNYQPVFMSREVEIESVKQVGQKGNHLKFKLKQGSIVFDAIYFNFPTNSSSLTPHSFLDLAYQIEENSWQGQTSLQLKIKDIVLFK